MIALDASVVIALLDAGDPHHDRAADLFREHAATGFILHPLTLAEILVGPVRAGRAHRLLSDLRAMGIINHESPAGEPLLLAELRATTGLKMPDCCVIATAAHASAPLASFDEQLTRVAADLGHTVVR
ncbi:MULTISPECIES: type II toxin-antitoxin system VapC family toxin [unclassified Salinibacterium]|uniref:type II toxin-antitoxin system VapC family toxin n=1 Tax=unclassified Salinibacterium TaxID=2632331 RepID=UPI00143D24A1|nr:MULTISPECIES: type II toxin-antitoxin system VapC family toxin [unclassified Salinibacterium]